jgi:hypothetical protein
MKSGEQIDGQMSSQSLVVWWYRDVICKVVGIWSTHCIRNIICKSINNNDNYGDSEKV